MDAKEAFGKRLKHKKDATNTNPDQKFISINGVSYLMFLQLLTFISDGFVDSGTQVHCV